MSIEKAISLETSSQRFFMKCSASTLDPIGRMMFESFAKESCVNRDRLERLYKSYYKDEYREYALKPKSVQGDAFTANNRNRNLDEKETSLPLMDNASKAVEELASLYRNLSEGSSDKALKKFFTGLAEEKAKNAGIMRTQYEYIKGTGCCTEYK